MIPVGSPLTAAVVIDTLQPATAHYLLQGSSFGIGMVTITAVPEPCDSILEIQDSLMHCHEVSTSVARITAAFWGLQNQRIVLTRC
jgi:hypothetical protein